MTSDTPSLSRLALIERLDRGLRAAERFHQNLEPRQALARARQTLRLYARDAIGEPEAQQLVRLIRQRTPIYRRAITRKTERTLERQARFRARERARITPPHAPVEEHPLSVSSG